MRRLSRRTWISLPAVIVLAVAGCTEKKLGTNAPVTVAPTVPAPTVPAPTVPAPTVPAPTVPAPTVTAPAVLASHPAPTPEEYQEFGKKLEAAINAGDQETATRLYRTGDLVERCLDSLGLNFDQGSPTAVEQPTMPDLAAQFIGQVHAGGTFTFLRVVTVDGQPRALIRLILPDQSVGYHELMLTRFPDGQIGVQDMFTFATGEMLSQSMRRMFLSLGVRTEPGISERLTAWEKLYAQHGSRVVSISNDVQQGRFEQALSTYRQLPTELKQDRTIQLLGLIAARGIGGDEYVAMLDEVRKDNRGGTAGDLFSIEYFRLKGQQEECLGCIERLDEAVGGDPYLTYLRGTIFFEGARYAGARAEFEKAIEQEPTIQGAYWSRITVALKEQNHADTLDWLQKTVEKFNVVVEEQDMRANDDYTSFIQSPQFGEFIEWYKSREK